MTTIKDFLKPKSIVRKCPHCKSNKGFELMYIIYGNGLMRMDFKGKEHYSERETFDKLESYANCINCGKSIETERLKTD